jgi:predicted PurR-regulated permease PerM
MPRQGLGQPVRDSFRVLGIYARGQVLLCLIVGVLYAAAFWPIPVPYWYVIGVVGGCTAIIPRIGSLVPLGLAVLALDFGNAPFKRYLIVLGVWLLIQGIEFFVLLPRLISRPLGLKEMPVIAALLLGSLVFGPIGLLLAVPVLAIGLVFWRHFRRRRPAR